MKLGREAMMEASSTGLLQSPAEVVNLERWTRNCSSCLALYLAAKRTEPFGSHF
jgi:hypothetical protein